MTEQKRILIVEDETKIAKLLSDYLEKDNFATTILDHGDGVVQKFRQSPSHLILLDLMLPGLDGISICREIRKFSNVPIIMLTARVEEIDRLLGLEIGADDYICKPFSPREVIARVKAVLRRAIPAVAEQQLMVRNIILDKESREVTVAGTPVVLTPSEFGLLQVLMGSPGRVFARSELLDRVQGYSFGGYDRTIDSHIKNLRKKVAATAEHDDLITTIYGIGYKLNP